MTPKMEAFVREYLVDLCGTKAAIRAGYAQRSAKKIAHELLQRDDVAAALATARREREERTKSTGDDVVRELDRLALVDPAEIAHVKSPRDIAKLPERVRRAIVGWKFTANGFELKLAKVDALSLLARHHGILRDKLELGGDVHVTVQNLTTEEERARALRKATGG